VTVAAVSTLQRQFRQIAVRLVAEPLESKPQPKLRPVVTDRPALDPPESPAQVEYGAPEMPREHGHGNTPGDVCSEQELRSVNELLSRSPPLPHGEIGNAADLRIGRDSDQ
jgi:hypothetical protein